MNTIFFLLENYFNEKILYIYMTVSKRFLCRCYIFFKIKSTKPCNFGFLSIPYGWVNPFTRNWPSGKVLSNFFLIIIEMSKLCLSLCLFLSFKLSNLFSKELMPRGPVANLFTFFILKWCKTSSGPSPEFWTFWWIVLFNVLTKTWNDLKRRETTYNKHKTTWKDL